MAMSDFTRTPIGYDANGFNRAFEAIIQAKTNQLSDKIIELFKQQIDINGNGSSIMKDDAKRAVREISNQIENGLLTLEVGIDEDYARSVSTQFYIRTMVVIEGNLKLGGGKLYTKPGQDTWKKHVNYHSVNKRSHTVYRLKGFEQKSKSGKILKGVLDNVFKGADKYISSWLRDLNDVLSANFFAMFVTGG